MEQRISIERMEQAINLFGMFDENIRLIERELGVSVVNRESSLKISGDLDCLKGAKLVISATPTAPRPRYPHWYRPGNSRS